MHYSFSPLSRPSNRHPYSTSGCLYCTLQVGYTASLSEEHVGYGATGQAPPTPNTQAVLDGLADLGRGHTPLPASLAMQTPPGSRVQARSSGPPVTGAGVTPPGSAERAGSRGGGSRGGGRRRDAQVQCIFVHDKVSF